MKAKENVIVEAANKRSPINKTAANVLKGGEEYVSPKRILTADQDMPIPIHNLHGMQARIRQAIMANYGKRFGRMTVIGYARDTKKRYVVRCSCGVYTLRTHKAINNPENYDMCEQCRHTMAMRRRQHDLGGERTGKHRITWRELDGL